MQNAMAKCSNIQMSKFRNLAMHLQLALSLRPVSHGRVSPFHRLSKIAAPKGLGWVGAGGFPSCRTRPATYPLKS